ncbi:hypothetical protein DUNSADRAFT_584 [Dunaliella salina]|uniref:Uncharacterized protein n=1 Tax=Dunaliella salina TaxID=3046 RepID=A0ABQ7GY32_DUNSA|nr:hypothetical protein DUNSADRAFT_584 [Dunaliella salina]|eukprot:KAF5839513.1 hypothetical protein DUNSADRAFT_584 [Dunaliella salina]
MDWQQQQAYDPACPETHAVRDPEGLQGIGQDSSLPTSHAQHSFAHEGRGYFSEEHAAMLAAHRASFDQMGRDAGRLIRRTRNRARDDIHKVASMIVLPTWLLPTSLLAVFPVHGVHAMLWSQAAAGALIGSMFACLDRYCNVRMHVAPRQPLTDHFPVQSWPRAACMRSLRYQSSWASGLFGGRPDWQHAWTSTARCTCMLPFANPSQASGLFGGCPDW